MTEEAIRKSPSFTVLKGMDYKEITEKNNLIQMYDDRKAGKMSRSEYAEIIIRGVKWYGVKLAKEKGFHLKLPMEDIEQCVALGVLRKIDEYDPHIAQPSSFFKRYIEEELKREMGNEGMTPYYNSQYITLDKVAKKWGFVSALDVPIDKLAILADMSITTVRETVEAKRNSNVSSLDAVTENVVIDTEISVNSGAYKTPEAAIIEKEQREYLEKVLAELNPFEQYVVIHMIIDENPWSLRRMIKELKDSPERDVFEEYIDIDSLSQGLLEQQINIITRRLRQNKCVREIATFRRKEAYEIIEQASEDDIMSAIADGLLEEI